MEGQRSRVGSADSGPRLEGPQGEEEEEGAWTCQSRINANECAHPRMSTFGINASLVPVLAHGKKRAIGKEQRATPYVPCAMRRRVLSGARLCARRAWHLGEASLRRIVQHCAFRYCRDGPSILDSIRPFALLRSMSWHWTLHILHYALHHQTCAKAPVNVLRR